MSMEETDQRLTPEVTVVIPVKNAAGIIGRVLSAVTIQMAPWAYEVIVIDSGSTDGTLDIIRSFKAVRLVEIVPEEYGHGRTRNLGVTLARGKYVALLTHDAVPLNNEWLAKLVLPLQRDDSVAGVFGRHVAHEGASKCVVRDLERHFENLRCSGEKVWLEDAVRYETDTGYQQLLHYYSDNNSCLRKAVWERLPYPDVDFAEDQLWAKAIIERGHKKAYAHDAVVKHSHDYNAREMFQRSFDESKAFKRYFGYLLGERFSDSFRGGVSAGLNDYRYVRSLGGTYKEAFGAGRNQLAKHFGHWLGARSEKFPHWLQRSLSLDMKLKYGKFRVTHGVRQFMNIARAHGLKRSVAYTLKGSSSTVNSSAGSSEIRNDVVSFFRAILDPKYIDPSDPILTIATATSSSLDALWFIPDFGKGSGGHLNIFRFIRGLEKLGMRVGVVIVGPHSHANHALAKARIQSYFGAVEAPVYFEVDPLPCVSKIIATSWITAHVAKHYPLTKVKRYYFVQDYEPLFYAAGFDAVAAASTYELGFQPICAGSWIANELKCRHGVTPLGHFGFSYDHDNYKPKPKRDDIQRVFFYARPPTARRGFELGLLALDLVGKLRPDVHFIFAGWDMSPYQFDHVHLNGGVLGTSELPDLYSQCDVALVLSFTNMSLLPYEVMACKCAVVTNDDACATWGLNEEIALFAKPSPEALAEAIIDLLDNPGKRREMVEKASDFVASTDWDREVQHVYSMLMKEDV